MSSRNVLECPYIRHRHYLDEDEATDEECSHLRFSPGVRANVNAENRHLIV